MKDNIKISFSRLKSFQTVLDGEKCAAEHYKSYVLHEYSATGEAALMGMHFEYLITKQDPDPRSVAYIEMIKHGKRKKNGDYYTNWTHLPEIADNFKQFCKGNGIFWKAGQTHILELDGIRHKAVTDVEGGYKGRSLILDLKCTSSITTRLKPSWSWKVDAWTDLAKMLGAGYKEWQALYYCAISYIKTGEIPLFMFYIQSSSQTDKSYFPYLLEYTEDQLLEFWGMINKLIAKEQEFLSDFDYNNFRGNYKDCVNCNLNESCTKKNFVADIIISNEL